MSSEECDLDPRIQIELENLNTATDEINKLEIELEEANSTFRLLWNESRRRSDVKSSKLGGCIKKARPYYDALERNRVAQAECQKAAVEFQRANEIHAAAKETVALAEQRFMSNSHEWQFDNAWQEMLNHATQKVMDAEKQKAKSHAEHQRLANIFNETEMEVQQLEERFRRSIMKSRPYYDERQMYQDQLETQKNRILELQSSLQAVKSTYATSLRNLERISDEIHRQRGDYTSLQLSAPPPGPREPGVGAELNSPIATTLPTLPDGFQFDLEKCDFPSLSCIGDSETSLDESCCSLQSSEKISGSGGGGIVGETAFSDEFTLPQNASNDFTATIVNEQDLEALRQKVKILAVRPIEGGDGQQEHTDMWADELNATVNKLDHLMMLKECARKQQLTMKKTRTMRPDSLGAEAESQHCDSRPMNKQQQQRQPHHNATTVIVAANNSIITRPREEAPVNVASFPATPEHGNNIIKKLQKLEPLPSVNVSMRELPMLARISNEIFDRTTTYIKQRRRRSLE